MSDLPALAGTPKQIAVAERVRAEKLQAWDYDLATTKARQMAEYPDQADAIAAVYARAKAMAFAEPAAAWWLDNRDVTPFRMMQAVWPRAMAAEEGV